jgi:hypothetical protein
MSPDRAAFLSRLSAGMAAKSLGQSDLARLAKVSRQTINTMFAEGRPGRKHLPAFAGVLGCSVEWLTTGTGPRPAWANGSDVVYGIAISSRDDRLGISDAVSVARTLYENHAHELVESLFFDTKIGHLFLHEKPGISDNDKGRICDALSRLDGSSALVEYEGEFYPDPNEVRDQGAAYGDQRPDLDSAPPWARRLLEEVQALRAEVAALGTAPSGAAKKVAQIMDPDEHPRTEAPTHPLPATVPGGPPRGR